MSNEAVSPLRRRMIDDMTIRHFGAKTQADSIRTVRTFAAFLGQSPDQAEPEDLRRFQLHMAAQGASPAKMNAAVSALRFFFHVTLGRVGFLDRLADAQRIGRLAFHGDLAHLSDPAAFAAHLAPLRRSEWVVYAKRPFAGPEAVLAYLSRYTHRVAISNSRLLALDNRGVTFRWKDYRARDGAPGREWIKTMTLSADEFIRRFLLHILPSGFHRIRHYGLFASGTRAANIARIRSLLAPPSPSCSDPEPATTEDPSTPACPCCGGRLSSSSASAGASLRRCARPPSGSTRHEHRLEHDRDHQSMPRAATDLPPTGSRRRLPSEPRNPIWQVRQPPS
jgi:hypothetical protein